MQAIASHMLSTDSITDLHLSPSSQWHLASYYLQPLNAAQETLSSPGKGNTWPDWFYSPVDPIGVSMHLIDELGAPLISALISPAAIVSPVTKYC